MPQITMFLLGSPRVLYDQQTVSFDNRKALALLAYLYMTGRPHRRDALATLFWPEHEQARARLRRTLSAVHIALGRQMLAMNGDVVELRPDAPVWCDIDRFTELLSGCAAHAHPPQHVCTACLPLLMEAVEQYRADFLEGFTLADCPDFDAWQHVQTERLRRDLAGALERLVYGFGAQKDWADAIAYAQRWVALDPLHDPAHRALMIAFALAGQRSAALRQYDQYAQILRNELDVPPLDELAELARMLRCDQPLPDSITHVFSAQVTDNLQYRAVIDPSADQHNAPAPGLLAQPATPFVGRATELERLAALLTNPACRLLTLVGPGGIGKSRLALKVAELCAGAFADGVRLAPLVSIDNLDLLVPTIASAVGFTFYGKDDTGTQLLNFLREKQMLLVLDNFEHLLGGATLIVDMLAQAPQVKLLVTSRERLNLQAEWLFPVSGLTLPPDEPGLGEQPNDAMELFVRTAHRLDPAFALSESNVASITRICSLVEGFPLGIELAAAWVRTLSCEEIATELTRNRDLLAVSLRDLPERHRSMRAVFEHSWRLLSREEQRALAQLTIFRGGFTAAAARAVLGHAASILSLVASLMDKSLIRRSAGGRYDMHELFRQYASEKLIESAEDTRQARAHHALFFANFLHEREQLWYPAQHATLAAIEAEIENIRVMWAWGLELRRYDLLNRAIEGLHLFFDTRCRYQEAYGLYAAALAQLEQGGSNDLPPEHAQLLARLLIRAGIMRYRCGEYQQARAQLERGLTLARRLQLRSEEALALSRLSSVADGLSEYEESIALCEQSAALYQELGDTAGLSGVQLNMTLPLTRLGRYAEAEEYCRSSITIKRAIGDDMRLATAYNNLGTVLMIKGDLEGARAQFEAALTLSDQLHNHHTYGLACNNLGLIARSRKAYDQAGQHFEQSLARFRQIGFRIGIAGVLSNLGGVAQACGQYDEAERYFTEALATFEELGDRASVAMCWAYLGWNAEARGDLVDARRLFERSLERCRQINQREAVASNLLDLGRITGMLGEYAVARRHLGEALGLALEIQVMPQVLGTLVELGQLYAQSSDPRHAVELLSAASTHPTVSHAHRERAIKLLDELAERMPATDFEIARASGERVDIDTLCRTLQEQLQHR